MKKCITTLLAATFLLACHSTTPSSDPPDPHIPSIELAIPISPPFSLPSLPALSPTFFCPEDMVEINPPQNASNNVPSFCIDRYEAPNEKGVKPFFAQTGYQGIKYCQNLGKDLCTQTQWQIACMGSKRTTYPYGNTYHKGICNDDKTGWVEVPWLEMGTSAWLEWCQDHYQGEPSGSRPLCVSDYGVYDLTGNIAEWTREPKSQWGYVVLGGYWFGVYGNDTPRCAFVNPAHPPYNFPSYEMGYRCCKSLQ